jgi:hypothetical protein
MVDTISIIQPHQLFNSGMRPGWRSRPCIVLDENGQSRSFSLDHLPTGFFTKGKGDCAILHSASLPRLLFGHNGKLIKDQMELDLGFKNLRERSAEIGSPTTETLYFTRVDLVWQFQVDVDLFIQAHRNSRHSRIRFDPSLYERRSLIFKGSEVKIRMYDKIRKMFRRNGNILRVEVELHGRRLMEELGGNERVTSLDFNSCYQAFRRLMLGFEPPPVPKASGIATLLATGLREGWADGGVPFFEWYTREMSPRHISRLRRDVERLRPTFYDINWAKLLPVDGPPPPIEIEDQ